MDPQTFIIIIFIILILIFNSLSKIFEFIIHEYMNMFHSIQSPNLVPLSINSSSVYLPLPVLLLIVALLLRWFVFSDKLIHLFWLQHRCWSDSKRTAASKTKTCRRAADYISSFHCYSADRIFHGHYCGGLSSPYEMSSRCHTDRSWGHSLSTISLTTCVVRSGT
jgi:hypothetical protein